MRRGRSKRLRFCSSVFKLNHITLQQSRTLPHDSQSSAITFLQSAIGVVLNINLERRCLGCRNPYVIQTQWCGSERLKQGLKNFPKIYSLHQTSRLQKADIKPIPPCGPTSTWCHRTQYCLLANCCRDLRTCSIHFAFTNCCVLPSSQKISEQPGFRV